MIFGSMVSTKAGREKDITDGIKYGQAALFF
jgi:hypothetical protein